MAFVDHIKQLLRDHGRAFIPGLGGFVKEYRAARLDRSRDLFLPPSCTLSFNSSLAKEDGLLAERIAEEEGLDFEKARQRVREKANEWQKGLKDNKRLELEGIGILYTDEEASLRFEPDPDPELELSSYGLGAFYVAPVQKSEQKEPEAEQEAVTKEPDPGFELERKGWSTPAKVAAVLLPLLIILGLGAAVRMNGTPLNAELLNLSGSNEKEEKAYTPRKKAKGTIEPPSLEKPKDPRHPPFSFKLEKGGPRYTVLSEKALKEAEKKRKEKAWSVVGGCFDIKANAEERAEELSHRGFPARILTRKRKGLHVVVFDSFAGRNKALEALQKARRTMRDAWLLHRP